MCNLDRKNNRKMCVVNKPEDTITFSSLSHYKVDIFSFSSLILISNYSSSERFLKSQRVCPQVHFLYHYKVDIFSFLTAVLIIYYSAFERFLRIELVYGISIPYP